MDRKNWPVIALLLHLFSAVGIPAWARAGTASDAEAIIHAQPGDFERWIAEGKVEQIGSGEQSEKSGRWSRFREDGSKRDEGEWLKGVPHGQWKFFDPAGQLQIQGRMESGVAVCIWKYRDASGQMNGEMKSDPFEIGCNGEIFRKSEPTMASRPLFQQELGTIHWPVFTLLSGPILARYGGMMFAPSLRWSPTYRWDSKVLGVLDLKVNLGAGALHRSAASIQLFNGPLVALNQGFYPTLEYQGAIRKTLFRSLALELGGGQQIWVGIGTGLEAAALISMGLGRYSIERVLAGYTLVRHPVTGLSHWLMLGVELSWPLLWKK